MTIDEKVLIKARLPIVAGPLQWWNFPQGVADGRTMLAALAFLAGTDGVTIAQTAQLSAPYPPSQIIRQVNWAPKQTIVRKAHDSDNWPMTWADDDALYTAYGDGYGFEPFLPDKLSLGLAKVTGVPPVFAGENIRAPSLEQRGGGRAGRKASGLLCVDDVLYLWARNATNSQLAWSGDHGLTWRWADWQLTNSFGCSTFLNFGRNYAGAHDEFVYIYSPDTDSAYEVADRLVLARVPKTQIRERAAYEFFSGLNAGEATWSRDLARRDAIFSAAGLCYRCGVTYDAALKRYLLVQPVATLASRNGTGKIDVRFAGGLAVYDAPAPWGPWTTAFFTNQWDAGPGDSASFPTKWMSADGKALYLVFSGDDNFSVRKAEFEVPANNGAPQGATVWPGKDWLTATPESQGMSSKQLKVMADALVARRTSDLLVIRNDKIVCEWHAPGRSGTSLHGTASMAKAIVGGVSMAVALTDGRVALDDPAAKFIPQWREDPRKRRITLRQLGSHTSGLDDAEDQDLPHERLTGWKGDFWKRLAPPQDSFTIARDLTPMLFEPGQKSFYSNPGIAILAYALTAALKDAPERDLRTLLRERVMRPIGVPDAAWAVGYEKTYTVDGLPLVAPWGGGNYTARAVARVGRLMLRQGNWEGRQLLSPAAVRMVTSDAGTPGICGIGWWSNNEGNCARLPKDAFWGSGAGDQVVVVVPSLNLIAVRNGESLKLPKSGDDRYERPVYKWFFEPLMDAVKE